MKKPILLVALVLAAGIGATVWLLLGGGANPSPGVPGDAAPSIEGRAPLDAPDAEAAAGAADAGAGRAVPDGIAKAAPRPASGESKVTGRVVDASSRSGIARARIAIRHPLGQFAVRGESADDGTFTIGGVPGVVGARVWLAADGYGPRILRDVHVPPHDRTDLGLIELERGSPVAGRVAAANGSPIAGAQVDLLEASVTRPGFSYDLIQIFRDLRREDDSLDQAVTSADGTFAFASAAPGSYVIVARKPGWQVRFSPPLTLAGGAPPPHVELRLAEGRTLRGVVTDEAGKPICSAEIAAIETDPDTMLFPKSQKTLSGADGRFAYSTFGPGQVALLVKAEGYSGVTMGNLSAGGKDVEIVLRKATRIQGRVFDRASGKGLPGAVVVAFRLDENLALEETRSGEDGAFAFETGPSGESVGLFAKLAGHTMAEMADALLSGETGTFETFLKPENEFGAGTTIRRDLAMVVGGSLSGRVVDQGTGAGIAGAEITARPAGGFDFIAFADPMAARSGSDGAFTIPAIGAGKFSLSARADGYLATADENEEAGESASGNASEATPVEVLPGAQVANVVLELRRGAGMPVLVTDPDGNGLPGASVTWMVPDERTFEFFGPAKRPRTQATDSEGKARLEGLPVRDDLIVAARHPDYPAGGTITVSTAIPSASPAIVALRRSASLAGIVIDSDGRPAGHRDLTLTCDQDVKRAFGEWTWMGQRAVTDSAGRFLVDNLPPGKATIGIADWEPRNRDEDLPPAAGEVLLDPSQGSVELVAGKRSEITLRLARTQGISGVVCDAEGRPLANVLIHVTLSGARPEGTGEAWGQSLEGGQFSVGGLAPGNYELEAVLQSDGGPRKVTRLVPSGSSGIEVRFPKSG